MTGMTGRLTPESVVAAWRAGRWDLLPTVDGVLTAETTRLLLDGFDLEQERRLDLRARTEGFPSFAALLDTCAANPTPEMAAVYLRVTR